MTSVHSLRATALAVALCGLLGAAAPSEAAVALGFREDFPGPGTGNWSGGIPVVTNPGTGGASGDGYLYGETQAPSAWGVRCRFCTEYAGNWNAAGITEMRLWLNDVGADQAFDLHVVLGNDLNLWQYNTSFLPPQNAWAEFVVDLTSPSAWTQIGGSGTLAAALADVDVVLIRHDPPPFTGPPTQPDPILGEAGIDRILLTNGVVGVEPLPAHVVSALRLAAPWPNPSSGAVRFTFEHPVAEPVELSIVDITGRTLRREALEPAAGMRTWIWDGLDSAGRRAPPGQYRVRAVAPSGGAARAFVLVH